MKKPASSVATAAPLAATSSGLKANGSVMSVDEKIAMLRESQDYASLELFVFSDIPTTALFEELLEHMVSRFFLQ